MTWIDWTIFVLCWSLIPFVYAVKAYQNRQQAQSERECWAKVDAILKRPTHDR